jgi:hypothetical protein
MMPAIRRSSKDVSRVTVCHNVLGYIVKRDGGYDVTGRTGKRITTKRLLRDAENFAQVHFACSPSWKELQNAMQPGDEEPAVE